MDIKAHRELAHVPLIFHRVCRGVDYDDGRVDEMVDENILHRVMLERVQSAHFRLHQNSSHGVARVMHLDDADPDMEEILACDAPNEQIHLFGPLDSGGEADFENPLVSYFDDTFARASVPDRVDYPDPLELQGLISG